MKRITAGLVLTAALIAAGIYGRDYWHWSQAHESTDNAFIDAQIVQVSSRIAGHVSRVLVADNQIVHEGDVLLELDPADFQVALDEAQSKLIAAQADLAAAHSAVEEARAAIDAQKASAERAKAELASDQAELERAAAELAQYQQAMNTGAVSPLEFGKIQTAHRTKEATRDASAKAFAAVEAVTKQTIASLQSREARVAVAEAQIKAAQSAVDRARLNLSYTRIVANNTGRVTRKSVEPGNYLIAGQPLMALVSPDVWITANFKETQLTHMQPGQPVDVEVDAYPGLTLKGHIDSIQQGAGARFSLLPPENATGNYVKVVQRVPVKIVLDEQPADGRTLGPGMSVVPTVRIGKQTTTQTARQ